MDEIEELKEVILDWEAAHEKLDGLNSALSLENKELRKEIEIIYQDQAGESI